MFQSTAPRDSDSSHNLVRWSPLNCLPIQTLTPSGLIQLDTDDSEVQLIQLSAIELRSLSITPLPIPSRLQKQAISDWYDRDKDLSVTCTTHRLVFLKTYSSSDSHHQRHAHFLHLCAVIQQMSTGGNWTTNRSYKIQLETATHGTLMLVFPEKHARDVFEQHLEKALQRRQWEETYRHLQPHPTIGFPTNVTDSTSGMSKNTGDYVISRVGVDKIIERNKLRHERAQQLTHDAFSSGSTKNKEVLDREVETLFREAKELTNIIQKYVATLEKNRQEQESIMGQSGSRSIHSTNPQQYEDTHQLTTMLQGMGMVSAMSKDITSSSSDYHELLARQLFDFLSRHASFSGADACGIMTLTDVYCLFNRARGANMISPDDLIESVKSMEKIGLGMKLREFEGSHVRVLQKANFDDQVLSQKLTVYIEQKEAQDHQLYFGITVLEASRVLNVTPLLANEILLGSERNGSFCRDVTLEGTRYYLNLFMSAF